MKIALIGYGKMGKEIRRIAESKGIEVKSIIDPKCSDVQFDEINKESMEGVDVAIDFTHPIVVVDNIKKCADLGVNMVVGTTAWHKDLEKVQKIVNDSGIGFIYASNFSLGVNLFFRMIRNASKYMNKFEDYDIAVFEEHHNKKADSPSGTGRSCANIVLEEIDRKKELAGEATNAPIEPEQLNVIGLRVGSIPGNHSVIFDSEADTIRLSHSARTRGGFASGAVLAAEWIHKKKGFFNIDNMMDEIINK